MLKDKHALESAPYPDHEWKASERFGVYTVRPSGFQFPATALLIIMQADITPGIRKRLSASEDFASGKTIRIITSLNPAFPHAMR